MTQDNPKNQEPPLPALKLRVPGRADGMPEMPRLDETLPENAEAAVKVTPKQRFVLGTARDGADTESKPIQTDDIACLEFSGGFRLWMRVDELYAQYGVGSRGLLDAREIVWEIHPAGRLQSDERGVTGTVIKALDIFGFDLAGQGVAALARRFEDRVLENSGPGLYRCSLEGPCQLEFLPTDELNSPNDKPLLVFIHGTASSTRGGFKGLLEPGLPATLGDLTRTHAATYAFEHRTLTESPISNALQLATRLPKGAELHLVSHSRGGLVGELLCLGQRDLNPDLLTDKLLDELFKQDRTIGESLGLGKLEPEAGKATPGETYGEQKQTLRKLLDVLKDKQFRITRFVRVACPAMGTTLASGRLDRWLSMLQFVGGQVGGPFVDEPLDLLLAVVKERTDPRSLPGLESMMPGSALTRLLNQGRLKTDADLTVIAGDSEGDSLWNRLKLALADWFYRGEHDLVVNTGSMYGGIGRPADQGRFFKDQGTGVDHFHYFGNAKTVKRLRAALTLSGPSGNEALKAQFQPLSKADPVPPAERGEKLRAAINRSAEKGGRPIVFVLPGTMGSHLAIKAGRIWLDYLDLARGGLFKLGIKAPGIGPAGLLEDYYGDLVEFLSDTHQVIDFPYDWRRSILDAAKLLHQQVEDWLPKCEDNRQPMRFIAHSMGGLVVRAMMAQFPQTWARIQKLPDSRLVMLGTPNAGSYEAVRWLSGWNPTLARLALLDLRHGDHEIVRLVNHFPGLLELLPASDPKRDFARIDTWRGLLGTSGGWPLPPEEALRDLRQTWTTLRNVLVSTDKLAYVAGCAPATVCDYRDPAARGFLGPNRPKVQFYATREGDGTVTWASGRLPGVKTWYLADVAHDELPAHRDAFQAYRDLLEKGTTDRLPITPPAANRSAVRFETFPLPPDMPERIPREADLKYFTFGGGRVRARSSAPASPRITVTLCHGHLAYARHPICVGHYQGDTIVSAEAELDQRLEGALSQRMDIRIYPGPLDTSEVFLQRRPEAKPKGAIVIGLGQVGDLTASRLESSMLQALLQFVMQVVECKDDRFRPNGPDQPCSAAISTLLIGTGAGGITLTAAIGSILRAVKSTQQRLTDSRLAGKVRIDRVEFLELYEDRALLAAQALKTVLTNADLSASFEASGPAIEEGQGGLRRMACQEQDAWWQRTQIAFDSRLDELRFVSLTNRARAEESLVAGQLQVADRFIEQATSTTATQHEIAQTLFEMLLPNGYKDQAPDQSDRVLVLDEISARYPWELLQDRWDRNGKPAVVVSGLLRQLKTDTYRPKPLHPFEKIAFVVGNPALPNDGKMGEYRFPALEGARREARAVEELLRNQGGYKVNAIIDQDAQAILTGLHADRYRILHLAGHGVHDFEIVTRAPLCPACGQATAPVTKRVSGMAIGENTVLTPGDIEQMRWVPELVFINSCHLGKTDSRSGPGWKPGHLAANLGAQFIRMGVRAVVAAGWAVEDAAAEQFASAFYDRLLRGQTLGEAVKAAREDIYVRFPGVNTWGAYQVYGDPAYRLCLESGDLNIVTEESLRPDILSPAELCNELRNLTAKAKSQSNPDDGPEAADRLARLLGRIPSASREDWLNRPEVAAALGLLQGEIGCYEQAVENLTRAIQHERADFAVKCIEQRANFRVKWALKQWREAGASAKDSQKHIESIQSAIQDLETLQQFGKTLERLSLLGSARKRLIWISAADKQQGQNLHGLCQSMAKDYHQAFDLGKKRSRDSSPAYPLNNWITAAVLAEWFNPNSQALESHEARLKEQIFSQTRAANQDFWSMAVMPDSQLSLDLLRHTQDNSHSLNVAGIAEGYRMALTRAASFREKLIVIEHLEFLQAMAGLAGRNALGQELSELLNRLTT
ncbi:MAG: CHAT domain-containing protein [Methylococcus sp.]